MYVHRASIRCHHLQRNQQQQQTQRLKQTVARKTAPANTWVAGAVSRSVKGL